MENDKRCRIRSRICCFFSLVFMDAVCFMGQLRLTEKAIGLEHY
jgi:hypothetical protein